MSNAADSANGNSSKSNNDRYVEAPNTLAQLLKARNSTENDINAIKSAINSLEIEWLQLKILSAKGCQITKHEPEPYLSPQQINYDNVQEINGEHLNPVELNITEMKFVPSEEDYSTSDEDKEKEDEELI